MYDFLKFFLGKNYKKYVTVSKICVKGNAIA